jgi:hypothetical protein
VCAGAARKPTAGSSTAATIRPEPNVYRLVQARDG